MLIQKDEPSNGSRRIPCRLFTSNGTSPDTGAQGDAVIMWLPSGTTISLSSALTAIHAAQGMYYQQLTQSEVSLLGIHALYHTAGDFPQHIATIEVVNCNPYSTLSAISDVTLAAKEYSNVTVRIGLVDYSGATIGVGNIKAGSYSGVTVGAGNIAPGTYSGVTVGINNIGAGSFSGVTIQGLSNYANISSVTLNAGTHSGATIQGVSNYANFPLTSVATSIWSTLRSNFTTPGSFGEYVYSQVTGTSTGTIQGVTRTLNLSANGDKTGYSISGTKTTLDALNDIDGSGVTLHAGTHSGATIQGVTRVNSGVTLNADTHSGATIAGIVAGGIIAATLASGVLTSAKFAAGAIDAAALATDAGQEIADALLGRNIAGGSSSGRIVSEALYPLRNRSLIQGSVGTVYQVDDATSAWTFSPSLGTAPLSGIDPIGP